MKSMQRTWIVAPVAVALAVALTGCGRKAEQPAGQDVDLSKAGDLFSQPMGGPQAQPEPGTVIAVVEGAEITWADINREAERALKVAERRMPPERLAQMRGQFVQQATDSLIVKTLLLGQADKKQVVITEEEVAEARGKFSAGLPPGVTLDQILAQQGVTPEEFGEELIVELRINKLIEQETGGAKDPTEEEIAAFYEEHRAQMNAPEGVVARHILVAFQPDDTDEAKQAKKAKIEEIRQKIADGGDFAALALEHSDCPSKTRGGVLPRFGRGEMVKPFEDAAFAQEPNVLGPVVETSFGYHIIEVTDHSDAHEMSLDEVREDLTRALKGQQRQKLVREYIEGLRGKAKIDFPGRPAAGS